MTDEPSTEQVGTKELLTPVPKAEILERLLAKFIDMLIVGALLIFPVPIGVLAGLTYILISDGLSGGQSIGKKIIGLRVVTAGDERPCDYRGSIIRNSVIAVIIAVYYLLRWVPYAGVPVAFIIGAAIVGGEIFLIYTDDMGCRFGDKISGTVVVDSRPLTPVGAGES